ncbi:hypothetical protein KFE25_013558 [Diacronema lutheri]|uniref:Uncharacterized protein n=1 Tax=Diacronema lutheri TaxID=2081491 RepID=A0A8J5XZL1_DIALT|nr:hypothetical protein KFE25_013558 [Diacronema lutheri]
MPSAVLSRPPSRGSAVGAASVSSMSSLPPRALSIRFADRAAFRAEWSALAARHRSRTGPDTRPQSAPAPVAERKAPFTPMATVDFFAMLDARWKKEASYGHTPELEATLRLLKHSVLLRQQELLASRDGAGADADGAARARSSSASASDLADDDADMAWGQLPAMDEEMMRSVQPEDARELLRAQQYELAAAAFLRGMRDEPHLLDRHAAGFSYALQQLRWHDPRYAGRFDTRLTQRTVRTANPLVASYRLIEERRTGQLVRPLADRPTTDGRVGYRTSAADEAEAEATRRRRTKPRYDDGSDARQFNAAMDLMVDELRDVLPTDDYEVAALRAFMAAHAVELVGSFRHYATLDRTSEAQMRRHAIEKAATISKGDFTHFCRDTRLLVASGHGAPPVAATPAPAPPAPPPSPPPPAADGGGSSGGGGTGGSAPPAVAAPPSRSTLNADAIATIFTTAVTAAILAGDGDGDGDGEGREDVRQQRPEPAARTPALYLAGAGAAGASAGAPGERDARTRQAAAATAAASADSALMLHSFLAALVRLSRACSGPFEPIAAAFESCYAQHFSRVVGPWQRDGRLREMLDSPALSDLYYAYEGALKPIFDFHAQLVARVASKWASAGGASARETGARTRTRAAIRKWIANRGPTIGFAEWALFWGACWEAVADGLEPAPPSSPTSALAALAAGAVGAHGNTRGGAAGADTTARARPLVPPTGGAGRPPRASAAVSSGAVAGTLFAPAVLQRVFIAAQSEEVTELARGAATADSAAVDVQMTWKEFWEALARAALEAPAPVLVALHMLNDAALTRQRIVGLDQPERGADGSAVPPHLQSGCVPDELLRPAGAQLSADVLHVRMEVVLQTAVRAFADLWGPGHPPPLAQPSNPTLFAPGAPGGAGAGAGAGAHTPAGRARAATAAHTPAAGDRRPSQHTAREVRQAVSKMRQTLAVRTLLGRARFAHAAEAVPAAERAGAHGDGEQAAGGLLAIPLAVGRGDALLNASTGASPRAGRHAWARLSTANKAGARLVRPATAESGGTGDARARGANNALVAGLGEMPLSSAEQRRASRLIQVESARTRDEASVFVPSDIGSRGVGSITHAERRPPQTVQRASGARRASGRPPSPAASAHALARAPLDLASAGDVQP